MFPDAHGTGYRAPPGESAQGGRLLSPDTRTGIAAKEVKVKLPAAHHVKLHSVKILTGKPIHEAISEALDLYFAAHPLEQAMADAGIALPDGGP